MPKRNPNAKDGTLYANAFYTQQDLIRKGYCEDFLSAARKAGVPVKKPDRRVGYIGEDLIAFIRTLDKVKQEA